jgi:SagB-type dehydrogenase family enzyme
MSALGLNSAENPLSDTSRYLGTRGFRQFAARETVPLGAMLASRRPLQAIMGRRRSRRGFGGEVTLDELATLLEQSLGCTSVVTETGSGLSHALRAWPSAGGLYPLDAYVLAARVADLAPAVYHYNPIAQQLERLHLREPGEIAERAFFGQEMARQAAATILLVAAFGRTISKYGERGYRLVLLDAGHAAQNLLLTAEQLELAAVAIGGFDDEAVASDLGLDGVGEALVHSVLVGRPG